MISSNRRARRAVALTLLLTLCGCQHALRKEPVAHAPAERIAPKTVKEVQRGLAVLGYEPGAADGVPGSDTVHAIRDFQRDQRLPVDGAVTPALAEKIKTAQAKLPGRSWAEPEAGIVAIFNEAPSGGAKPLGNFLLLHEGKESTDAPQDFLQPLRPGTHGSYKVTRVSGAISTVSCAVGHLVRLDVMAGSFDAIDVACTETNAGAPDIKRRWFYAPEHRLVIREETATASGRVRVHELIALIPPMSAWPAAARTGFDWALTHALEGGKDSEPVLWSSTAVPDRFSIAVDQAASPSPPVPGRLCRHYVIARVTGDLTKRYPGLACETQTHAWEIAGATPYRIARPAMAAPPANTAN